ncbi:hypothetical protein H7142_02835 [Candidatus Saccharibacteria bacterium]|nr:hypothetical protein [Candidatus Saccharibacteria bacterium]
MSAEFPHYSGAAKALNDRGGLDIYFAAHGEDAGEWTTHLQSVVQKNAAMLLEAIPVDHSHNE